MMTAVLELIVLREERDDLKGEVMRLRTVLQTIADAQDSPVSVQQIAREALEVQTPAKT